jgi:predicted nuclease with TOPRIM domain
MKPIPYGSSPPPRPLPENVGELQQIVHQQREQMQAAQADITELKDLARRLNAKYETEQKRMRQLQENLLLSNAQARNLIIQNEDVRQRLMQLEVNGIEQRHVHVLRHQESTEGKVVAAFGLIAIAGMFLMMLYAVATMA